MQDQTVAAHLGQGEIVGDYEIVSVAGSGGMGVVYKATQLSLGRLVALKVIRDEIARLPEDRGRFLREARLAASVDHPNGVSVYDVGDHEGRLYLAMQWMEGRDLTRLLAQSGPSSPDRAVAIALQLAGAIDAIEVAGLIHRDIEPANVVIRQMGASDHAYLTDFGVAKPSEKRRSAHTYRIGRRDRGLRIAGADPRRAAWPAKRPVRPGMSVLRDAHRDLPFHGENEMALRWAHTHDPRPLPSQVAPQLGDRNDTFFATALALYPSERFYSGREFASSLSAAQGAPGVIDATPTTAITSYPPTAVDPGTPIPPSVPVHSTVAIPAQTPVPMYPAYGYATPAPMPAPPPTRSGIRWR
jgi:hypothetical protein